MQDFYKKLSKEIGEAIDKSFNSPEYKAIKDSIAKAEQNNEDVGSFKIIISTATPDRSNEVVVQEGLDITRYMQNPIVLWAHDYDELPIGITEKLSLENGQWVAEGKFAPESANPIAQQVRRLYDLGIQRAASIGFICKNIVNGDPVMITESELLEWSFVPVPANSEALALAKKMKLDIGDMRKKGLFTEEKKKHILKIKDLVVDTKKKKLTIKYTDGRSKTRDLTGTLLKTLSQATASPEEKAVNMLKEAIGPILANLQSVTDNAIVEATKGIMEAIVANVSDEKNLNLSENDNSAANGDQAAGSESGDTTKVADENKSRESGDVKETKAQLDEFYRSRDVLRTVSTVITNSLADLNKKIKEGKSEK